MQGAFVGGSSVYLAGSLDRSADAAGYGIRCYGARGFTVWGSGFRVQGLGFGVQGSGFGA